MATTELTLRAKREDWDEGDLRYRLAQVELELRKQYAMALDQVEDANRGGACPLIEALKMREMTSAPLRALGYQNHDFRALTSTPELVQQVG